MLVANNYIFGGNICEKNLNGYYSFFLLKIKISSGFPYQIASILLQRAMLFFDPLGRSWRRCGRGRQSNRA
jgi:hypothetical protein